MMKIHAVNSLIAIAICALLVYGIVSADANLIKMATGFGAFISLASTLVLAIGVSFDNGRTGTNMRTLAFSFFVAALAMHGLFAFAGFSQATYVITCGVFVLVYVLLANALLGTNH
jgi:hypothetical protein